MLCFTTESSLITPPHAYDVAQKQVTSLFIMPKTTSELQIAEISSIYIPAARDRAIVTYITLKSPPRSLASETSLHRIRAYITRQSTTVICCNPLTAKLQEMVCLDLV